MLLLMERLNLTQLEWGFAVEVGSLAIPLVGKMELRPPSVGLRLPGEPGLWSLCLALGGGKRG